MKLVKNQQIDQHNTHFDILLFMAMDWAVDTTGLIITSVTCCWQEAQSVNDTSSGRSGTRSCW